jgi:hypothetical protein
MADKRLQIKRRIVDDSAPEVGDLLEGEIVVNLTTGTIYFGGPNGESIVAASGGSTVQAFSVDVNFGSLFTNYKQHVVTGLTWITPTTKIVITPYTASNNADEIAVVDFSFVVSDIVPGTGFTLTIYTEVEVKGTYTFNCLGV